MRIHLFFVHPLEKNNGNKLSSIVLLSGCSKISGFALSSAHFKWQRATAVYWPVLACITTVSACVGTVLAYVDGTVLAFI